MYIVVSLVFMLLGVINGFIERKVYNPLTIFLVLWGIICILPGLHLYDLFEFEEYAYLIVVIGALGFTIGYLIFRFKNIKFRIGKISFTVVDLLI